MFNSYANYANDNAASHTAVAGRYSIQAAAEKLIVIDLVKKLELNPTDHFLEIGCGPGTLAIPISYLVEQTHVVEHKGGLARVQARMGEQNIGLHAGDFFDVEFQDAKFSKILIYSVVQCLPNFEAAVAFTKKAFDLLAPGGRLLIGDLPNEDKKVRFASTSAGQKFAQDWRARMSDVDTTLMNQYLGSYTGDFFDFDDETIFALAKIVRSWGAETYILPQPVTLPFGHTREDIVVIKT